MNSTEQYLKDREVAEILKCSVQTLANHRHQGRGLPYFKDGRSVWYSLSDIRDYMDKKRIVPGV